MNQDLKHFLGEFENPPLEYTLVPFWFLNDELDEKKIYDSLMDFLDHGVYGVIPHPRIGLPHSIDFMSERWIYYIRLIVEVASRNKMIVILYDEGMYPSGSCAGKVVAKEPLHSARAIVRRIKGREQLKDDEELIYEDEDYEYVHTRSMGTIRGIHFGEDDGEPNAPPAGDILNPEAVESFLDLVLDTYHRELREFFGNTIIGIFTDEPSPLGRKPIKNAYPWTWGMLEFVNGYLGYDFRKVMRYLWEEGHEMNRKVKRDFENAVLKRLEESFYKPYMRRCEKYGIQLAGHPKGPMDLNTLRYFHIPGQDIVWRWVEPYKTSSIEGPESTVPKCSVSAKIHYRKSRNLNECFGAYGWELTYEEMEWLTGWLLIRGVDMLVPHAFYYSIEGPRRNERPPDVGPNSKWWDRYKTYADKCRRLCWLNGVGELVVDVAVLVDGYRLPWSVARILLENQVDYLYLDFATLIENGEVYNNKISVGNLEYSLIVCEDLDEIPKEVLKKLEVAINEGRCVFYGKEISGLKKGFSDKDSFINYVRSLVEPDVFIYPANSGLRYRHVKYKSLDVYVFFNESRGVIEGKISVKTKGDYMWFDPNTGKMKPLDSIKFLRLLPGEISILLVIGNEG
ncbi:MAG: hypothetical protein N3G21_07405 [Candidatus Hydrogenedentes bacterium]|nr:hypothetical protein [Candidatus Hydrogenedentota bacterium]